MTSPAGPKPPDPVSMHAASVLGVGGGGGLPSSGEGGFKMEYQIQIKVSRMSVKAFVLIILGRICLFALSFSTPLSLLHGGLLGEVSFLKYQVG